MSIQNREYYLLIQSILWFINNMFEENYDSNYEKFIAFYRQNPLKVIVFGILAAVVIGYLAITSLPKKESAVFVATAAENQSLHTNDSSSAGLGVPQNVNNQTDIYIDLSGAVSNPGVYKLKYGSRVIDVLKLGGPLLSDASSRWVSQNVNLAGLIYDAQKIYIPFESDFYDENKLVLKVEVRNLVGDVGNTSPQTAVPASAAVAGSTNSTGNATSTPATPVVAGSATHPDDMPNADKINVNTATQAELETLNGIGKAYSQRIIDNRPYTNINELAENTKIPNSTIEKIKDFIMFNTT